MWVWACVRACVRACMWACMCARVWACACGGGCLCMCVCTRTRTRTRAHIATRIFIVTFTRSPAHPALPCRQAGRRGVEQAGRGGYSHQKTVCSYSLLHKTSFVKTHRRAQDGARGDGARLVRTQCVARLRNEFSTHIGKLHRPVNNASPNRSAITRQCAGCSASRTAVHPCQCQCRPRTPSAEEMPTVRCREESLMRERCWPAARPAAIGR